jgi:hypothetical protein
MKIAFPEKRLAPVHLYKKRGYKNHDATQPFSKIMRVSRLSKSIPFQSYIGTDMRCMQVIIIKSNWQIG